MAGNLAIEKHLFVVGLSVVCPGLSLFWNLWTLGKYSSPVPNVFIMAAVLEIGPSWRIRAIFVEKGFVLNVLQRLKTPVTMHIQRRVRFKPDVNPILMTQYAIQF